MKSKIHELTSFYIKAVSKKLYTIAAVLLTLSVTAKQVEQSTARLVAENFIRQTMKVKQLELVLTYTAKSNAGDADYYAFNLNDNIGFVIVAGDDVATPIIGYSNEGAFVAPVAGTNFGYWMGERQKEIEYIRANHLQADAATANKWAQYISNSAKLTPPVSINTVAPLCAAKWGQTGTYNDLCPGGSMTGCVATAMAIIMKKWAHPTKGTGQSSYNAGSYGTLSANYGNTTYNFAAMTTPYCSGSNTAVATLMSHCGISVQMSYSPQGSGAQVIGGNPSAQYAYKTYFGYDPSQIKGLMRSSYQDPAWTTLLKNDLDKGQPIQYAGVDASAGGHTWVCDGYDASDNMHMNWGWDGSSNGYFGINNMAAGGFNFSSQHQVCIGIVPGAQAALDAGIPAIITPNGTTCNTTISPVISMKNFGTTALTSCTINYKVDNGANQTYAWTGSLASYGVTSVTLPAITVNSGAHTFTSFTSSPNGSTDGNTSNDQTVSNFNVTTSTATLPMQEGFEAATTLPSGWTIYNPDNDGTWAVSTTVGKGSSHSIAFDNCNPPTDISGEKDRFISPTYNLSAASSATMTFDVAYAKLDLSGTIYADTLAVLASTNCGSTWTKIYLKGGTNLATAPDLTAAAPTCFTPTASQWRNESISLQSFVGQSTVMFAFENRSQWAEFVYLDNINITMATGVEDLQGNAGFSMYPNPTSSSVTIQGTANGDVHYVICDMLGATVKAGAISSNGTGFNGKIDVNELSKGMYFLKVSDGDSSFTKKLSKQ